MPAKKIDDFRLLELLKSGGKTVSELAQLLGVTRQAVTQKIKRWKRYGIVDISPAETLDLRRLKLGNFKVYKLTKLGQALYEESSHFRSDSLRGGDAHPSSHERNLHAVATALKRQRRPAQLNLGDFAPEVKNRPVPKAEVHGLCYRIPIVGEPGIYPPHLKEKRMQNWTKYHGHFMGAYIYFTPSNVFFFLGGIDDTREDVHRQAEERARKIWVALKHQYGWELANVIERYNHTTGENYEPIEPEEAPYDPDRLPKYGVVGLPEVKDIPAPQLGKKGYVDGTPWAGTLHTGPKHVDKIIENHRFINEHLNELVFRHDLEAITEGISRKVIHVIAEAVRNGNGGAGQETDESPPDDGQPEGYA